MSGCSVVGGFVFGWGQVPECLVQRAVVEPVDVLERGERDSVCGAPRAVRTVSSVLYSPILHGWFLAGASFGFPLALPCAGGVQRHLDAH